MGKGLGHHQATLTCGNLRVFPDHTRAVSKEILEKKYIPGYPTAHGPESPLFVSSACIYEKGLKTKVLSYLGRQHHHRYGNLGAILKVY